MMGDGATLALIEGPPQVTTGGVRIRVDADDVKEGKPMA
jgi:hypothetical protein